VLWLRDISVHLESEKDVEFEGGGEG
jgi:hypothetical protein